MTMGKGLLGPAPLSASCPSSNSRSLASLPETITTQEEEEQKEAQGEWTDRVGTETETENKSRTADLRVRYIASMLKANPKMLLADSPIFAGLSQQQLPFSVSLVDAFTPECQYEARIRLPLPDGNEAWGVAVAGSKKQAERDAAVDACEKLNSLGLLVSTQKSNSSASTGWGENPKNILVTSVAFRSYCCGGSAKPLPITLTSSGPVHEQTFVAELCVPIQGQPQPFKAVGQGRSKAVAERACCYAACERLFQEGLLKRPGDSSGGPIHSFNKALHIQEQNERTCIVSLRNEDIVMIEDALRRLQLEIEECTAQKPGSSVTLEEHESVPEMTIVEVHKETVCKEKLAIENTRLCLEARRRLSSSDFEEQRRMRQSLPSWVERQKIIDLIASNQVVVLTGETGCGKTTQVPQFILEDYELNGIGAEAHIVITQPRRIAAISVAERVAWERGESVGKSVGYSIRLENTPPRPRGSILYCTTGILLGRLQRCDGLAGISHIVIDEVHERDLHIDFLLVVVRELLKHHASLRLVVMSATVDSTIYTRYFSDCPAMNIPGFMHPVQVSYLEDIESHIGQASSVMTKLVKAAASQDEDVDVNLVAAVVLWVVENFSKDDGAVLCFLPGLDHIITVKDRLQKSHLSKKMIILPLHSLLPAGEQRAAFARAPPGLHKVVLATNIAETSVTIDDVVYVVDSGKVKEKQYDPSRNINTLQIQWTSQASARQRQGRAGRVRAGFCFRLYTKEAYASMLPHQLPEMHRLPLEELCLQIKSLTSQNATGTLLRSGDSNNGTKLDAHVDNIATFLSMALQPPKPQAIHAAIKVLHELGAIDKHENLTPLGATLAKLAIPPRFGKMLVYGALLGSLDPLLTIAAAACFRDPFVAPVNKRPEADKMRQSFAVGASYGSDQLAVVTAYENWCAACSDGQGNSFCEERFLSPVTMKLIAGMRRQLRRTLSEAGISEQWIRPNAEATLHVARCLLVAGLYPNIASSEFKRESRGMKNAVKHLYRWKLGFKVPNGRVLLHPTSVITEKQLNPELHYYLVFLEKVRTNQVFVRGSTLVPPLAVILMGWSVHLSPVAVPSQDAAGDWMLLEVEGWLKFFIDHKSGSLLLQLCNAFDKVLSSWVSGCTHRDAERHLLKVVVSILEDSCNAMLSNAKVKYNPE